MSRDVGSLTSILSSVLSGSARPLQQELDARKKQAEQERAEELQPTVTAQDGFVAFDPAGTVVGSHQPGARLTTDWVRLGGLAGFAGRPLQGPLTFTGPEGTLDTKTNAAGEQSYPIDSVTGVDGERGGLLSVGITTPGGRGDTAHVLALPKSYDGPLFICDIDDTLRATRVQDILEGKTQSPIAGAAALLDRVAALGVPIVYLSAGPDQLHEINEGFLAQLPPGVLLDREKLDASVVDPSNRGQAEQQGNFKSQVLGELQRTFPQAQLFGLGDDKYGDAQAYTRAGATTYIHDVKPDHANVPDDFHGTLTTQYTPQFVDQVTGDLKRAIAQSASFGGTPVTSSWMDELSRQLDATTHSRLTTGNTFSLDVDGEKALPDILATLDAAKKSICYEVYNFYPDDPIAEEVASHLIAAKRRGVDVRLNVDAFGARELPLIENPTVQRLKAAGVQVCSYNAVNSPTDFVNRDHRKTIVVDGQTAFVGGMNTSNQWMGPDSVPGHWHDLFAKVRGPVVQDLANAFESSWVASGGAPFDVGSLGTGGAPASPPGSIPMRIVTNIHGGPHNIRAAYFAMIDHARKSINVENSFPLENDVTDALVAAAERGVQVRLIVGGHQGTIGEIDRYNFQRLLDAGVQIFVYPTRVHSKALSVDGQVCTIGSANVDAQSLEHNREIIDLIQDPTTTQAFDAQVFDRDVVGDSQGQRTVQLPRQLDDPTWRRLVDGILHDLWPNTLE